MKRRHAAHVGVARTRLITGLIVATTLLSGCAAAGDWLERPDTCEVVGTSGAQILSGSPDEVSAALTRAVAPHISGSRTGLGTRANDPRDAALIRALGRGPVLSCRIGVSQIPEESKQAPLGLTPRAQALRAEVRRTFGPLPDGGFGPQDRLPGRRPEGLHTRGRAIDFFFRPYSSTSKNSSGWVLANWLVANADRLGIQTVIFSDHIWTARRSSQGWRDYTFAGADASNPINRHLDHVHVDVF